MSSAEPGEQARGGRDAYDRYFAGMDASMRQKVALTAAHFLARGRIADMGMGSGGGSLALAELYPGLQVTGVDVSKTAVALARGKYSLPNLFFVEGDVSEPQFPEGSMDGILDSSVLHHVTTFGGYRYDAAARALEVQSRQLAIHGTLVVRDFVAPDDDGDVLLDLPLGDGDASDDPRHCSTAALFERFSREFRSLAEPPTLRGFELRREDGAPAGFRCFRMPARIAAEFILRKDYRADWEVEVKEEYTYFSQSEFERLFARLGLRVLASSPLRNPWILRNRFDEKVALCSLDGRPLDPPPTNYVIVGERVAPGEGVRFREGARTTPVGFLQMSCYRDRETGRVRDLVRRPHLTLDVIPWFVRDGELFIVARRNYPRPILSIADAGPVSIDGRRPAHYVSEPLAVLQRDEPAGTTVERTLEQFAGITPRDIIAFRGGCKYYTSPGGLQEEVHSLFVEIAPSFADRTVGSGSGFSTSGTARAIEARQLLRAAQVGGLPDSRLEMNVYALLRELRAGAGPWIGEEIHLREAASGPPTENVHTVLSRPRRRRFEASDASGSPGFISIRASEYEELDAEGRVVASRILEAALPTTRSIVTASAAVLRRRGSSVEIAVEDDDLPAAQCFEGNSNIFTTPAWRLPADECGFLKARAWLRRRLRDEHGVECGAMYELGGCYHPSPGATPEVVYPFAAEAVNCAAGSRLVWIELRALLAEPDLLRDGHLRTAALRAAHALGLLAD